MVRDGLGPATRATNCATENAWKRKRMHTRARQREFIRHNPNGYASAASVDFVFAF